MQFLLEQSVGKRHSTVQGKWLNPYQCFANTKHLLPFELILITGDFRKRFFDVDYYSKLNRILDLIGTFTLSCKEVEVTLISLNFFKIIFVPREVTLLCRMEGMNRIENSTSHHTHCECRKFSMVTSTDAWFWDASASLLLRSRGNTTARMLSC